MGSKKNKKKKKKEELKKLQSKPALKKSSFDKFKFLIAVGIIVITSICFSSSLNNQFVNWDDDKNFLENDLVSTIDNNNFWENSVKIFKSDVIGGYNPLTIFTFAIEKRVFGYDNPYNWHLNNLILHIIATLFVFLIGCRLKLGYFGAAVLALLFGIHPMRVESVAWITERKDVLFGAFYFAAFYFYVRGKQDGFSKKLIILIAVSFILSLLSKIQAVLLPISLILVDYYLSKGSKLTFKSILSKWPFFIGSLIIGFVNIYFLSKQGSIEQQEYHGISRIFIGAYQMSVYYIKSIIPYRLSPLYPYPSSMPWYMYASILIFIITGVLLWFSYIKKWKVWFFGIGFFVSNVFLLLQIVGAGQGFLADRFTYIAYFGLFFIMAYYAGRIFETKANLQKVIIGMAVIILGAYGYITYNQNKIWKNSNSLWTHVLKYYTKTTLPYGNRANYRRDYSQQLLTDANRIQNQNPQEAQRLRSISAQYVSAALQDYAEVIRLAPNKPEPYNSRARLYFNFTQRDSLLKALENYNKAIELKPNDVEFRVNRGATYAKLGDLNNAIIQLNEAEKIDPTFGNIYLNRSVIYNQNGDLSNALKDINKYLEYNPYKSSDMWYEKARLHNNLKDPQNAVAALDRAIAMQRKGIYYFERAKSYYYLADYNRAKQDVRTAQQAGYNGPAETVNRIMNTN